MQIELYGGPLCGRMMPAPFDATRVEVSSAETGTMEIYAWTNFKSAASGRQLFRHSGMPAEKIPV
jgi:hypothetical protein